MSEAARSGASVRPSAFVTTDFREAGWGVSRLSATRIPEAGRPEERSRTCVLSFPGMLGFCGDGLVEPKPRYLGDFAERRRALLIGAVREPRPHGGQDGGLGVQAGADDEGKVETRLVLVVQP